MHGFRGRGLGNGELRRLTVDSAGGGQDQATRLQGSSGDPSQKRFRSFDVRPEEVAEPFSSKLARQVHDDIGANLLQGSVEAVGVQQIQRSVLVAIRL